MLKAEDAPFQVVNVDRHNDNYNKMFPRTFASKHFEKRTAIESLRAGELSTREPAES
jgi:hypothetical protein